MIPSIHSNSSFLKYSLQVVDYNQLVQPCFDKAREMLINQAINEITEKAIADVKERLTEQLEADKKGELSFFCRFCC